MRHVLLSMVIAVFFTACATGEKMGGIHEGMSKSEVIERLGNPDGFQRSGEYEALKYTNRLISGFSWDRTDYTVILKNGQVVEYGPGEIRQRDPNTGVLIIAPTY